MKKNEKTITKIKESSLGLFDLDEFVGYPVQVVNDYFKKKGWEMIDVFDDYKWVWQKTDAGKRVIVKTEIVDNNKLGNEIVTKIHSNDIKH